MAIWRSFGFLIFSGWCLFGQSVATTPTFEVASVKRNPASVGPGASMHESAGGIDYKQVQLRDIICHAYGLQPSQISGGPDWINSEAYDIMATVTPPHAKYALLRAMLQTLLAERFKLVIHREQKDLSVLVSRVEAGSAKGSSGYFGH